MKEIELSFTIRILPKQTDVHWIEGELLRLREEVFLGVLRRVMLEIEREELRRKRRCQGCGAVLVRNGREARRIKTLVGEVEVDRVRLRCQVGFLPFAISLNTNFQKLKAWLNA